MKIGSCAILFKRLLHENRKQFTNIPLNETIKLAVDLIKTFQPDLNISEKDLTSLFNFATCEIHFLFKGEFYD